MSLAATYIQVSSTLCLANCTLGLDSKPDCSISIDRCCSPNTMACTRFYTCLRGQLLSISCPQNHGFQEASLRCRRGYMCYPECSKRCVRDDCSENCCFPDQYNCKYFHSCIGNKSSLSQCPEGSNFDEYSLACVPGYQCFMDEPAPCPQLCESSSCSEDCCRPSPICSTGYTVCKNEIQTYKTCPENTRFNPSTLECDEDMDIKCSMTENYIQVTSTTIRTTISGGRRLMNKEEFLAAIYSVYTIVGEKLSVEIT